VAKFERRMNVKIRRQKKVNITKERDFRRRELLEKYIVKMLYE